MASVTLAEATKLSVDDLVSGVVNNIITSDQLFQVHPFAEVNDINHTFNRYNTRGDVQRATVGTTITAKAATTFTQLTRSLTKIIGDVEHDDMVQAGHSNTTDQLATQILAKSEALADDFRDQVVNGDGLSNSFSGLLNEVTVGQTVGAADEAVNGGAMTLADLDKLLAVVKAKNGRVDFITWHTDTDNKYLGLLRAAGGAMIQECVTLPDGSQGKAYRNSPIFRNDNFPVNQTKGAGTNLTSAAAGCWDDGSKRVGITALHLPGMAAPAIENIGAIEDRDERIIRLKWYVGYAVYNDLSLGVMDGIDNA